MLEVLRDLIEGFSPTYTLPTAGSTPDRKLKSIFIVVDILQGNGLRADVSTAERVVFITTNIETFMPVSNDFYTADRFAEIAATK